ncbi:MAG TPA: nucleoside triphosphate pyrophosphohydrolase [Candidatus Saccharimonadales bacterium]|nr:nucleoside triphosphate pyrophosphohydrolase [Candidatus Saccharimonadales bacterium]
MPKFIFNKLVRDKIVEQQIASGADPEYYTLDKTEHAEALVAKILEEAQEIPVSNRDEAIKEIADVQQALDDLKTILGLDDQEIANAQAVKNERAGAFTGGIFVESVTVDEGDKWVDYYRKNADKYPEVDDEVPPIKPRKKR